MKVRTKVISVRKIEAPLSCVPKGTEGVIVGIKGDCYLVQFEGKGNAWWCEREDIEPLKKEKKEALREDTFLTHSQRKSIAYALTQRTGDSWVVCRHGFTCNGIDCSDKGAFIAIKQTGLSFLTAFTTSVPRTVKHKVVCGSDTAILH